MKSFVTEVIYGRRRSFILGPALYFLAMVYRGALLLRALLFRLPFFVKKLPCMVISVGNITLGGTGKTPTVINIVGLLSMKGRRPAVVSRGYGRKNEDEVVVVSDGVHVQDDTVISGDEPVLIAMRLAGVPVVVGSDRYRASLKAVSLNNAGAVVLDDGFQHVRLQRDLDIVLLDAGEPFGNGKLFPSGILREPLSALGRAHAVLITRADGCADLATLRAKLHRYTNARIFTSSHAPLDLVNIATGEVKQLFALKESKVLAFSGIARPESFQTSLKLLGASVVAAYSYPDHHGYTKADLAAILHKASVEKVSMIITTEKDAVRLRAVKPEGVWALRIFLKVVEADEWEQMLTEAV